MTQTLSLRVDGYNIKQNTSSIILHLELKLLDKYKNAKFLTATEKKNDLAIITYFPHGHCRKGQGSRGEFLSKT